SPVHIHMGASHYLAHVVPLSCASLPAGEAAWVQLVFDEPVCAMPGDRYIVRDAQARHTIGGGVVLDPEAPQRKRRSPERLTWLQAVFAMHVDGGLSNLLEQAPWGLDAHQVMRLMRRAHHELAAPPGALWVSARGGQATRTLILEKHRDALCAQVLQTMASFHVRFPDEPGVDSARLRRLAMPTVPESSWPALLEWLIDQGQLVRNGPWLHLPDHAVKLAPPEHELAERLLPLIHAGGFDPPWVRDLADQLSEAEERVRQILLKLLRRGELYQVVRDLFYHREQVISLAH